MTTLSLGVHVSPPFFVSTVQEWNVPLSLVFVLPHSLLPPARLYSLTSLGNASRILYNLKSALALHVFLANFVPLPSPVVMVLPIPPVWHVGLSVGCLGFATAAMVATPGTWGLLGVGQLMGWSRAWSSNPEKGMDAITWMGAATWRWGGAGGFVLFTGLSILPARLTLGDCIVRGVAALYLRQRSRSFQNWVGRIERAHLFTWALRALLLVAALCSTKDPEGMSAEAVVLCALGLGAMLRFAEGLESPGDGSVANCEHEKRKAGGEDGLANAMGTSVVSVTLDPAAPKRRRKKIDDILAPEE